jgi:hypothetical protein
MNRLPLGFVSTFAAACPKCRTETHVRIDRLAHLARCAETAEPVLQCPVCKHRTDVGALAKVATALCELLRKPCQEDVRLVLSHNALRTIADQPLADEPGDPLML